MRTVRIASSSRASLPGATQHQSARFESFSAKCFSVGMYPVAPSQSVRVSYPSLNDGPVQVTSTGNVPIIVSHRVAYSPDGGTTWSHFAELMGLPGNQLSTSYVMPWYNNVDLNTQLRFAVP